jgi:hydroxyethylthiazole kinase-like uncharacterized protein yjeF
MIEIAPAFLRQRPLPVPVEGDKKSRGNVLIIAGATELPGAAMLAGIAALRGGAGRLRIATCVRNATALAVAVPEARVIGLPESESGALAAAAATQVVDLAAESDAVLLGAGFAPDQSMTAIADALLAKPGPAFVFDAGAIKGLRGLAASLQRQKGRIIVTPHAGEMAGLMGMERRSVEADPARTASQAAHALHAVVALKGAQTVICSTQHEAVVCRQGNVGLATSGSGDVLAGLVAGLAARGASAFGAACWGVYVHAKAGDRLARKIGPLGFLARELLPEIPGVLTETGAQSRDPMIERIGRREVAKG